MKRFIFVLLLHAPLLCLAQTTTAGVRAAEKSFAAYAVQQGTKAAFLQFADSTGVIFQNGKILNARKTWQQQEPRPGILNWQPVYALQAASGELGFTTGPWTFQPKTLQDSVVARGQYSTVWHKTAGGDWKFLADIGVSRTPDFSTTVFPLAEKFVAYTPGTLNSLLQAEAAFIQQSQTPQAREAAYMAAVSGQAFLLNRNGRLPVTAAADLENLLSAMPAQISYRQSGSGIARSGDLGFVYGTTTINAKEEGYLRIWRREGAAWKLVLEVLPF